VRVSYPRGVERPEHVEDGSAVASVWCLTANVVRERPYGPAGAEQRRGLRLLSGGAKVWVVDGFGGDGWATVTVIGHHRKCGKYLTVHVLTEHLTGWRARLVYSPAVRHRIRKVLNGRTVGYRAAGFWVRPDIDPSGDECRDDLEAIALRLENGAAHRRADRAAKDARIGQGLPGGNAPAPVASVLDDGSCQLQTATGEDLIRWATPDALAVAWISEIRAGVHGPAREFLWRACMLAVPGVLRLVTVLARAADGDDDVMRQVGAGPLEHLLTYTNNAEPILPEIEAAAGQERALHASLGSVRISGRQPVEIRRRLLALGAQAWSSE
jgi:hypothetical protein